MDDSLLITNSLNMGATSNSNGTRLATLQEKKKSIEDALDRREKDLKELCLQEAELTGIIPSEMPLQPGESPPSIRRKVGTLYMLSEKLLEPSSNKDESISDLELQLQLHANMAEAALGLAHKQNLSKSLRKQHKTEYQHHKRQYKDLQEKIAVLKEAYLAQYVQEQQVLSDQQKQKKKPRPIELDDGLPIISNEPFPKQEQRQSLRSLQYNSPTENTFEMYSQLEQRRSSRSSEVPLNMAQSKCDDLSSSFYKLNLSGYKFYVERSEHYGPVQLGFNQSQSLRHQFQGSSAYQHPSHQYNHFSYSTMPQSSSISQHIPISETAVVIQQTSSTSPDLSFSSKNISNYYQTASRLHHLNAHSKYNSYNTAPAISRQSSPHSNSRFHYPPLVTSQSPHITKNQVPDPAYNTILHPHQLQPHQQYEQNAGLGGCWRRKENGEIIWCNNVSINDFSWRRDKRFGSLDRRKNRKMKRISPNEDTKSATLATTSLSSDNNKSSFTHQSQVQAKHPLDRQLVRTQSLGSVGVQTSDTIWRSDDNSSCDSENHEKSRSSIRRHKQKEWRETYLDSPELPTSSMERCQSTLPIMLEPEERYIPNPSIISSKTSKRSFEIPAESNPRMPDTNIELFNNNIPKNGTLVQAGHCRPYHEETKPFEMSDFYKYSTKFKKSPSKNSSEGKSTTERPKNSQRNLNEYFETKKLLHHSVQSSEDSPKDSMSIGQLDNVERKMFTNVEDAYTQDIWFTQSPGQNENNNATLV